MQIDEEESNQNSEEIKICIPGMRISISNKDTISGPGTYELDGYIYTHLAGILKSHYDDDRKVRFCYTLTTYF